MNYTHLFAFVLLSLFACNTAKKTTTTEPATPKTTNPLSISAILSRLEEKEIKPNWMAGNATADYSGKPMNISVSMNIRLRRDSVIWINVKKLGFNVARAQVTTDSVFVVNYIQGNYVAKDLKYVEKQFGIPADFKTLQNILLGNPVFLTDKNKLMLEKEATGDVLLKGKDAQWQAAYRLDPQGETLKDMQFEQLNSARKLKIAYDHYDILRGYAKGDLKYSYLRTLDAESPQTGKVSIAIEVDTDGLEINIPKAIKFDIPAHYRRMD